MHFVLVYGYHSGKVNNDVNNDDYAVFLVCSDIESEGQWTNYYTGQKLDTSVGVVSGGLKGGTTKNCGLAVPAWKGWNDWQCKIPKAHYIPCACEHPNQMYLQLRGLCPDSNIDRFYVPKNKKRSGAVQILGLDTTIIEYDKENVLWKLIEHSNNITASTSAPLATYVLGSHEWLIENDNIECSNKVDSNNKVLEMSGCKDDEYTCGGGQCTRRCRNIVESYKTVLKLTGCREGEFTCSDGQCIRYWVQQW